MNVLPFDKLVIHTVFAIPVCVCYPFSAGGHIANISKYRQTFRTRRIGQSPRSLETVQTVNNKNRHDAGILIEVDEGHVQPAVKKGNELLDGSVLLEPYIYFQVRLASFTASFVLIIWQPRSPCRTQTMLKIKHVEDRAS